MIERITVIGGGSTGHMVAAVMSIRGFHVTLTDTQAFSEELRAVEELGGIQLRGAMRGTGVPQKVTTDPAQAIPGAQAIFVDVPAGSHLMWRTASTSSLFPEIWAPLYSAEFSKNWA